MTVLAVDAGNSRIKWGIRENEAWRERGTVATLEADRLQDVFAAIGPVQRVVVSNVAGERVAESIGRAVSQLRAEPDWVVSRREQCGVRSSYDNPAQLGPDRWAALIGARALHPGAAIVVNAGTTLTADALDADGIFLGGLIIPGYAMMREALARETAGLKLQDGAFRYFPDNTGDAIVTGALSALAGAVERLLRQLRETAGSDAIVILSGGDSPRLAPLMSEPPLAVDNLVLEGLARIGTYDG